MWKILMTIVLLAGIQASFADAEPEQGSALGLDYLAITGNELLASVMFEVEPKLMVDTIEEDPAMLRAKQLDRASTLARSLSHDMVMKSWMRFFSRVAPDAPLIFLGLDQEQYPNLWNYGELVRLQKDREESLRLYEALHGKRYEG